MLGDLVIAQIDQKWALKKQPNFTGTEQVF